MFKISALHVNSKTIPTKFCRLAITEILDYLLFYAFLGGQEDDECDGFEIIETSGSRTLLEQLIAMDLAGRPVVQQISIGGASGWYAELNNI